MSQNSLCCRADTKDGGGRQRASTKGRAGIVLQVSTSNLNFPIFKGFQWEKAGKKKDLLFFEVKNNQLSTGR